MPMPPGCGDAEFIGVAERVLVPAALHFRPELILVSCGFDAHRDDPLASMELSGDGYGALTRIVRRIADEVCGGRVVCALEGGYAESGLREGTGAVLDALLEPEVGSLPHVDAPRGSTLHRLLDAVSTVHGARIPKIGGIY